MANVRAIKAILRVFELASGLKINFAKSGFGAFGATETWQSEAVDYLNCSLLTLPFTYLGTKSIWWRDLKLVFQHPQHGVLINNSTLWKVGCGDRFKFWEDAWMGGEESLLARYPRLYRISSQQNQYIQHMGVFRDTGWEWDFRWRRPLFDNEVDMAASFLREVECLRIQAQQGDQWVWKADSSGQYTAKSAYCVLRDELIDGNLDGAFEELWKLKIPSKITVFDWRLIRDRLPTRSNLRRRQIEVDDPRCPFYRSEEESASHLFFHCNRISPVWWESLSWVNLTGAFPKHPRQHFLYHIHGALEGKRASRRKWWWLALTWTIWKKEMT
ncbi:putative ribonuclease H protein [Glycine max]|nr:putative ribonuclease H protein [Glycine max]